MLLVAAAALCLAAAKPVGLWQGNSYQRVGELMRATLFNPQWTQDKPKFEVIGKVRDFSKYSAVVHLYGFNNPIALKGWSKTDIKNAENYVRNGGVILFIFDGTIGAKSNSTGALAPLLGAKNYGVFSGKAEIKDPAWADCGKIPLVFKKMLGGDKYATLKNLTSAKMVAGNSSGALIAENRIGKGKVYFINVRLTHSAVNYRRPGSGAVNADLDQLYPFVKKFHSILMAQDCALVKDNRELWSYVPTGPKVVHDEHVQPERKPVVSKRKFEKLPGAPVVIAENGEAKALFMVGKGLKGDVSRLVRVVKLISGATIPYAPASSVKAVNGKWAYRGKIFDTRIVYQKGNVVEITASGNMITIKAPTANMGIQTLLREAMGYHVLWPGDCGEVYTKSKDIKFEPFKLTDAPFFKQRKIRNSLVRKSFPWKAPDGKIVRLPYEKLTDTGIYGFDPREVHGLRREHGGNWYASKRFGTQERKSAGGGTFYPWKSRFMKSHPEYFALQFNGTRIQRTHHVRICKSNPAVIKQTVEDARKTLDRRKDVTVYNVSPCDGSYDTFCRCANCRAWDPSDAPRGATRVFLGRNRPMYLYVSSTDRVFRFTCEVAKEIKKTHPKVKVGYLAYAGYLAPPKYYRDFPDNLTITFVGMQYLNRKAMERDRNYWKFWARVSDELILRPNHLLGGGGYPLLYMHEMAKDLRYCAETGMVGSDYDSLIHQWANNGLNYYVLAEMLWDPSQNVDDIIDNYCRLGFGKGAEAMKKYFLHCEKLTGKFAETSGVTIEQVEDLTVEKRESMITRFKRVFTAAEMEKLAGYLKEARELTKAGSMERRRVEFITVGYDFTKNRLDFAEKFAKAGSRAEKLRLSEEQRQYWWKLYKEHPFAVSIPGMFRSQYLSYWRHAGWKAPKFAAAAAEVTAGEDGDAGYEVAEKPAPAQKAPRKKRAKKK